jgi:hypothetical protein
VEEVFFEAGVKATAEPAKRATMAAANLIFMRLSGRWIYNSALRFNGELQR